MFNKKNHLFFIEYFYHQGGTNIRTNNNNNNLGGDGHQIQQTSNGFTPVQNAVLNLLKTVTTMTGYSVTEICKHLKQFSENNVKYVFNFDQNLIFVINLQTNFGISFW